MLIKPVDALTAKEQELEKQLEEIKRKKDEAEKERLNSNENLVGRCYKYTNKDGDIRYILLTGWKENHRAGWGWSSIDVDATVLTTRDLYFAPNPIIFTMIYPEDIANRERIEFAEFMRCVEWANDLILHEIKRFHPNPIAG